MRRGSAEGPPAQLPAWDTARKESKNKAGMWGGLRWGEKDGFGVFTLLIAMLHLDVAYLESGI